MRRPQYRAQSSGSSTQQWYTPATASQTSVRMRAHASRVRTSNTNLHYYDHQAEQWNAWASNPQSRGLPNLRTLAVIFHHHPRKHTTRPLQYHASKRGDESPHWKHVTRHHTEGSRHPRVVCLYCAAEWKSNELGRVIKHLRNDCQQLPFDVRQEFPPDALDGDATHRSARLVDQPTPTRWTRRSRRQRVRHAHSGSMLLGYH